MIKKTKIYWLIIACILTAISATHVSSAAASGRVIEFLIEEKGAELSQIAIVQDGKILIQKFGGDPFQDFLFHAASQTLFIINHRDRSYYKIDQNVINKVASMVDSINTIAGSQQGVLSDLLNTMGLAAEETETKIRIKETDKILSSASIKCRLYQEYRNENLVSEICLAPKANLKALGDSYNTLNSFYAFGDRLLNNAGSVLTNMGMAIPRLTRLERDGIPILMYMAKEKIKTSLIHIQEINTPESKFVLPNGYVQTPIPFIG